MIFLRYSFFCFVLFFRYRSTFVRMVVGGFLPFKFVVLDVIYQTGKTVFNHISKHQEESSKKHNTAEYF